MRAKAGSHLPVSEYFLGSSFPRTATFEEERREVLESVRESLRIPEPDGDRMAACFYLLSHLARTEPRGV